MDGVATKEIFSPFHHHHHPNQSNIFLFRVKCVAWRSECQKWSYDIKRQNVLANLVWSSRVVLGKISKKILISVYASFLH